MHKHKGLRTGWFLFFLTVIVLAGCENKGNISSSAPSNNSDVVSLTITGYNYTDRYINDFFVESSGGGNVFVSSPNGGGGSSFCCTTYVIGATLWKPLIRWQVGGCTFNSRKDRYGDVFFDIHHFYREMETTLDPKIPDNPKYLEVHFYPDGHVETAITELPSRPRLLLSADREDKSPYKVCPNDKEPELIEAI